jgi:lysophospholipase L1-like esterase
VKRRARLALLLAGTLVALLVGEGLARVWVALRWSPERIAQMTTHSPVRGRFTCHPFLPFVLNPDSAGHNSLGLRGPPIAVPKADGVRRVACIGASTTYGEMVAPEDAYPARLGELLAAEHGRWEVLNAGVPGYVSAEILVHLLLRVLPLEPDVVVFYEGRNELLPQSYNGLAPDYSHFRRSDFNFTVSNFAHKRMFRWSHLWMLLCTVRGERFGWSEAAEHPLYGGIDARNRPGVSDVERNLAEPDRAATWRRNLRSIALVCQGRGITVVLCTMAFRPDRLALNEIDPDPRLGALLAAQLERNNRVVREVADEHGAVLVETAALSRSAELFLDDCHMNPEGHRRQAQLVFEALTERIGRGR